MTREAFAHRFGEDQAAAIEAAAEEHKNGVHDDPGSDAFRWALLICVGYGCWEDPSRTEYHGITVMAEDLNLWLLQQREWLSRHDGDVDYIALLAGTYDPLIGKGTL